jgi:hypothetical protein
MSARRTPLALLGTGLAALALTVSATPALGTTSASPCAPLVASDATLSGQAAVTALGSRVGAAAIVNRLSVPQLTTLLRTDPTAHVDSCGQVLFVDPSPSSTLVRAAALAGPASMPSVGPLATALAAASGNPLALSSRPGSRRTLYLDFLGVHLSGTAWNTFYKLPDGYLLVPPNASRVSGSFTATEAATIREVWLRVSEDYAPFDIDVTTRAPEDSALDRESSSDDTYGTTAAVTADPIIPPQCNCGGQAWLGVIGDVGSSHDYYQPALVFSPALGPGYAKFIAEAVSHEVGHNFGLQHHGISADASTGRLRQEYYHGAGAWAPIMGCGYSRTVTQWSHGEYVGASQPGQDDLAVIALNAPLAADDHAGSAAGATPLTSGVATAGLITSAVDEDWFSVTSLGGATSVVVDDDPLGNLDVRLDVLTADGTPVATSNPLVPTTIADVSTTTGLDAAFRSSYLPAGTYRARVTGTGQGDVAGTGYSAYGSLGRYTITATSAAPPALTVTAGALPEATVGQPYAARIPVAGALGSATWTLAPGALAPGLVLDPSTGGVTGTPRVARSLALGLTVRDTAGRTTARTVRLDVRAPVRVTTSALPAGRRGSAYRVQLRASGGSGRAYWSRWGGALPSGVHLSSSGLLSGRPTVRGTWLLHLQVADTTSGTVRPGRWAMRTLRLTVG